MNEKKIKAVEDVLDNKKKFTVYFTASCRVQVMAEDEAEATDKAYDLINGANADWQEGEGMNDDWDFPEEGEGVM
jgi:hypothetical protein